MRQEFSTRPLTGLARVGLGAALAGLAALAGGCGMDAPAREQARRDSTQLAQAPTTLAPAAGEATPHAQAFPSGMAGPGSAPPAAARAQEPARPFAASPGMTGAAPKAPPARYNPNMYVANTYLGGTGARDRLEKLIREGVLVEGKRVKLDAFSRTYTQSFPLPTRSALNVFAQTERARILTKGERTFLQVGLQAMKGEAPRRPPLNVALVIDQSGSMGDENKMEFARAAAIRLLNRLEPTDILSVVAFDDQPTLLVPAGRVGSRAPQIQARIAGLTPGSGTNIYGGLELGYREARRHAAGDAVTMVLLLSDGEATAGITDPEQFRSLAAAQVPHDIQTTTVGMGVQFNEELMMMLAQEGKGNYHFLKEGGDAEAVFAKELEELTHVVARAVRLRIRLADGVGLIRVLGTQQLDTAQTQAARSEEKRIDRKVYEELGITTDRQRQPEEPGIKMLIPHFYRGDHHIVMLEIQVPPGRGKRPVAEVFLKYKDVVARSNREMKSAAAVQYTPEPAEAVASVNRAVKKNLLGFQTGEALARAASLIGQGRASEAVRIIDERMVVLGVAAREWRDRDLERDGKLLDRYRLVLAQLGRSPQLAHGEFGDYLKKSLTYAGYQLTR